MDRKNRELNDVLLKKPIDKCVNLANRLDLHRLASFIDINLPHRSDLHNLVLSALNWINNSSIFVYFGRDGTAEEDNDDQYSAIVAFRVDRSQSRSDPESLAKSLSSVSWFKENKESLLKIWDSIDIIDWNSDLICHYVMNPSESIPEILAEHLNEKGANLELTPRKHYEMERQTALSLQIPEIANVYVKSLENHHASVVYNYWPYKMFATVEDVMDHIDNFPSGGVFLKENNQLVSWIVYHAPRMGKLYTVEEHRKRGYASLVTRYLCKRLAQAGYIPSLSVVIGNDAASAFFESIGFKNCGDKPHFDPQMPPSLHEAISKNFSSLK